MATSVAEISSTIPVGECPADKRTVLPVYPEINKPHCFRPAIKNCYVPPAPPVLSASGNGLHVSGEWEKIDEWANEMHIWFKRKHEVWLHVLQGPLVQLETVRCDTSGFAYFKFICLLLFFYVARNSIWVILTTLRKFIWRLFDDVLPAIKSVNSISNYNIAWIRASLALFSFYHGSVVEFSCTIVRDKVIFNNFVKDLYEVSPKLCYKFF